MVLTFQKPILVLVLALKTSILLSVASIRFSPLPVTRVSCDDSGSLSHLEVFFSFVAVSVTRLFLQNRVVSPVSNPRPGGRGDFTWSFLLLDVSRPWFTSSIYLGLRSAFSSPRRLPAKANELHLSGFVIRVFRLLDELPAKANELHLPGFGIRVLLLLGYVGPRHPIPYYSGVTPQREGSPIHQLGDAPQDAVYPQREVCLIWPEEVL